MFPPKIFTVFLSLVLLVHLANGGPAAYGVCQAGCAAIVVACYAAGGLVFGTVTAGLSTAPTILACNSAFGTCQAACWAALVAPTP
uniref:Cysteine-rich protein n=1 Tax=Globodera rostochiensis TaxID=31243 RepID=A0A914HI89_GLORO